MKLLNIFKKKPVPVVDKPEPKKRQGLFNTHPLGELAPEPFAMPQFKQHAMAPAVTSDNGYIGEQASPKRGARFTGVNEAQLGFFAAGSMFIGYQACAMLATNWLIDKACSMPSKDAVRKGYLVTCGSELVSKKLREHDERFKINENLSELINFGRVYGGRLVLFRISNENPEEFYKAPFNPDIQPGTYQGMVQIDPNWVTPVLTEDNLNDPASPKFYKPTFWRIKDRIYHHSHLHIFVPYPVTDFLKPTYNFLGVPVPQRMMERAYAAERSANEGPQLLMTKRLVELKVGEEALANPETLMSRILEWIGYRDNQGVKISGPGESVVQHDTALADVDTVIMTGYQLGAAVADVPATKLLGTQPKGFNTTGDYEESVYREHLESIQSDQALLLKRHYNLVAKSEGIAPPEGIDIQWLPLDSPTAKESAEIEKSKADRDKIYFDMQAIDAKDVRDRIRNDRDSDYHNIEEAEYVNGEEDNHEEAGAVGAGAGNPDVQGANSGLSGASAGALPGST